MRFGAFLGTFLALILAGCATTPPAVPSDVRESAWEVHSGKVSRLSHWRLTGRVAIISGPEAWHVTADWKQEDQHYDIHLIAPLGQGSVRLVGGARQVRLYDKRGEMVAADDPAALLYREFGWQLPVEALRFWVLGLPAPGGWQTRSLDADGRLKELQQDGWQILFSDYEVEDGVALPGKVFAARGSDARVKLRVSRWRLEPASRVET